MFGQMTAGSWIYIGTQGILQGTYQTFCAAGEKHFGSPDLSGRTILTPGLGGMGGAQPLAATMAGAAILCVEIDQRSIDRRLETRYVDEQAATLDDALARVREAAAERRPLSVALRANAADVFPELVARGDRLRPRDRPDRRPRPADRLRPGGGAVRGGRGAPRARPRRVPTTRLGVDRRTRPRRWSGSSGWGVTFSTMATTFEVRPIERE